MSSTVSANFTNATELGIRPLRALTGTLGQSIIMRGHDEVKFPAEDPGIRAYEFGKCLKSNSSHYVTVTHDSSLNKGTGNPGIEFWLKVSANSLVIYNKSTLSGGIIVGEKIETTADGRLKYSIGDGVTYAYGISASGTGQNITDGHWHHVFCYADKTATYGGCDIYIDGVQVRDTYYGDCSAIGIIDNSEDVTIGNVTSSSYVYIDEFRSYKDALLTNIADKISFHRDIPLSAAPLGSDPSVSVGTLVCHFKFDETSGSTFADETANSNDGAATGGTCAAMQDDNGIFPTDNLETASGWSGTLAFRLRLFSQGGRQPLFKFCLTHEFDVGILNGEFYFVLHGAGANILSITGIDLSAYVDSGEWITIVVCWDFFRKIDGTNYCKIYVNETVVGTVTRFPEEYYFDSGVYEYFGLGCEEGSWNGVCDSLITYQFDSFPWFDTIANAEAAGFPCYKSVEHWYNDGDFNDPVVDQYTKSVLLPEIGSSYPQLIYPIFNSALYEDTETTDSSTHLQAMVTDIAENYFVGQYLLIYYVPEDYAALDCNEIVKISVITDNGDGTVTLTFSAALALYSGYTTANKASITNQLFYNGHGEFFSMEWLARHYFYLTGTQSRTHLNSTFFDSKVCGGKGVCATSTGMTRWADFPDTDICFYMSCFHKEITSFTGGSHSVNVYIGDISADEKAIVSSSLTNTSWNNYELTGFNEDVGAYITISGSSACFDSMFLFQNLLVNPGFDDTYVSDVAPDWTKTGTPTVAASTTIHSGTASGGAHTQYAQSVNGDSSNYVYQTVTGLIADRWYTLSGWVSGSTGTVTVINGTDTKTITGFTGSNYRKFGYTFKTQGTSVTIRVYGSGGAAIFDDFSLVRVFTKEAVSGDVTTESERYTTNKEGVADSAFLFHNDCELYYAANGVIRTDRGSVAFLIKTPCRYDCADQDFYLMEIEEVFRLYYDASEMKFKFSAYDGSSWNTAETIVQSFLGDEWLWVFAVYDNTDGLWVHGSEPIEADDKTSATWDAQSVSGKNMFLFSDKDGNYSFDGIADYPHGYDELLSIGAMKKFYNKEF